MLRTTRLMLSSPRRMAFDSGKIIGERYAIEKLIGRGGMGEVYVAEDTRLGRKIALKVVREDKTSSPGAVARLRREARAIASLSHQNVVAVHDIGDDDGMCFIVMELVQGESLLRRMSRGQISIEEKVGWLVAIARALASAHAAGVIHRDVKPSNIMISPGGVVKVVDFGLARTLTATSITTKGNAPLGTPGYMAPEQLLGASADERTDQYAFGMTAYHLIANAYPGPSVNRTRLLSDVNSAISPALASVIARTLALDPVSRFDRMSEIADALEALSSAALPPATIIAVESTLNDPDTTLRSRTEEEAAAEAASSATSETTTTTTVSIDVPPPPPLLQATTPIAAQKHVLEDTLDATNPPATAPMPTALARPMRVSSPNKIATVPLAPLVHHNNESNRPPSPSSPPLPPLNPARPTAASTVVLLCVIAVLVVAAFASIVYAVLSFG